MADRDREDLRLLRRIASGRKSVATSEASSVAGLVRRGLLEEREGKLALTPVGLATLRRRLAGGEDFSAQHQTRIARTIEDAAHDRASVIVNDDESPLTRLLRTKDHDGRLFIAVEEFAAGERLRAEFTRGQLMPRITANWNAAVTGRRRGGNSSGMADMNDAVIAARQRVHRALAAVGPEFAGVLLDFCCFLKGITEIERERRWPVRSAKLVIRLALASLARHYGLTTTGIQTARSPIVHWGGEGYRPDISPAG